VKVSVIFAQDKNGAIGFPGPAPLPWHYPEDLKRFKELTKGKSIIMGNSTYESLPGLLPGRFHYVITRRKGLHRLGRLDRVQFIGNLVDAIVAATEQGEREVFVIGGAELINSALDTADVIYRTVLLNEELHGKTVEVLQPWQSDAWSKFDKPSAQNINGEMLFETWVRA